MYFNEEIRSVWLISDRVSFINQMKKLLGVHFSVRVFSYKDVEIWTQMSKEQPKLLILDGSSDEGVFKAYVQKISQFLFVSGVRPAALIVGETEEAFQLPDDGYFLWAGERGREESSVLDRAELLWNVQCIRQGVNDTDGGFTEMTGKLQNTEKDSCIAKICRTLTRMKVR